MSQTPAPAKNKTAPKIRRIITGHDAAGKAIVSLDDFVGNHKYPDEKTTSSLVWCSEAAPDDFLRNEDMGARILGTNPPVGGTRFTVLEIDPGNTFHGVHRSDTLDYVIVLQGEMTMLLDDGKSVDIKAGDIMIQRGTNHAWRNNSNAPVRFAVILIDGRPKRSGSISGTTTAK